ncbi:hypothetical protein GCM10022254_08470 [Actinomadura meridiana]|uniref:Transposase n=1 Tax=Actinomadura meridiana TaxID=559626 RepID=A0ABP8BTI5_9ACTN
MAKPGQPTEDRANQHLIGHLVAQAREQGLESTGEGGLWQ